MSSTAGLRRTLLLVTVLMACLLPAPAANAQALRRATFDFTGDGTSDLLFSNGQSLAFWDFDAGGVINARYFGPSPGDVVGVGDYNGDGTSDLLTRIGLSGETGYRPVRNGVIGDYILLIADTSPNWHVVGARQRTDFNGDGRDDILWRHDSGELGAYLMNTGGGALFTWLSLGLFPREWQVIGTGDFDGDDRADVLWRHESSGAVRYLRILPAGNQWLDLGSRPVQSQLEAVADFDGDGTDDISWTSTSLVTPALANEWWDVNGGAVDAMRGIVQPALFIGVQASGDYLGDGADDLVGRVSGLSFPGLPVNQDIRLARINFVNGSQSGSTDLLVYTRDWQLVASVLGSRLGPPPRARRATYDFTGDGTSDLLFRDPNGQLTFWDIGGPPLTSSTRVTLGTVSPDWSIAGVGDYNGDRTSDILFRHRSTGAIGYWRIWRGVMTDFVPLRWDLGLEWQVVSSRKRSDFNGDGRDDVLLRHANGALGMYLVTGPGPEAIQWVSLGPSDPSWTVAGTADFSGDGRDDILFRNPSTGAVGYVRMGNSRFEEWVPLVDSLDAGWYIGALGDFNGDGSDDIYWRTSTTLLEGYWDMVGGRLNGFVPNTSSSSFPGQPTLGFNSGDFAADGSEDVVAYYNSGEAYNRLRWLLFVNGTTVTIASDVVFASVTLE